MLLPADCSHRDRSEATAAISREVVRIHARSFGHTPSRSETVWHDDVLVCTLEGVLTEPERALVGIGRFDRVRGDRLALHEALEPTYRALIETLTGRPVRSYMSDVNVEDLAFEVFMLGPAG
jgi:uncharacterized protein YbcI